MSNPIQRGYRKRIRKICGEGAKFQTKSQRLVYQVRTIIKKVGSSDLKILEIHEQINRESRQQDPNTIIDTLNAEEQKPS